MDDFIHSKDRPPRRMPAQRRIHEFWTATTEDRFQVAFHLFGQCDPGEPTCYACPAHFGDLFKYERCHLIDRCRGGLDTEANLILLCETCHRAMPSFGPSDIELAMAWPSTQRRARLSWFDATARTIVRSSDPLTTLRTFFPRVSATTAEALLDGIVGVANRG